MSVKSTKFITRSEAEDELLKIILENTKKELMVIIKAMSNKYLEMLLEKEFDNYIIV